MILLNGSKGGKSLVISEVKVMQSMLKLRWPYILSNRFY